jgi:hypothetical protein
LPSFLCDFGADPTGSVDTEQPQIIGKSQRQPDLC